MANQRLDRSSNTHRLPDVSPNSGNSVMTNDSDTHALRRKQRRVSASSNNTNSMANNGIFVKLLALVFVFAIFDVINVWTFIDDLENGEGDEPHHLGPEAGLHNLHEKRRVGNLYQNIIETIQLKDTLAMLMNGGDAVDVEAIKNAATAKPNFMTDDGVADKGGAPAAKANINIGDTFGVDDHIVNILRSANVEIDEELASQLPTWPDIVSLYGDSPIIHGLETCEPYRQAVKPEHRMIGPAGLFNTGTNLLFELMKSNCDIVEARKMNREPRKNGMRWQVPWGKHNPPTTHRFKNVAKAWGKGVKQDDFMPVVLIKDPYSWMGSQCRHKYTTFWGHDDQHCPNLIRWRVTDKDEPSEVRVKFALNMEVYESLLDMWNQWYNIWEEQTFPAIHTRFEDLLFHGEEVVKVACDCVGGVFTDNFRYVEDSAKRAVGVHKGANGLVKAMLEYGDPKKRLHGFTDRDRWYASKNVRTDLMRKYGYAPPALPT